MTTQPDSSDLATINAVTVSASMFGTISSMEHPDPKMRRGIDFALLDRARAVAERWVAAFGADAIVPGTGGRTPAGILRDVQDVAAAAEPYRPRARRA